MVHYTVVNKIDCPDEWNITNDWDSHRPLLWLACENIDGDIVEAGIGYGSTMLLRVHSNKEVYHFESNKSWIDELGIEATLVDDWLKDGLFGENIGILFVDLAPGEVRKDVIEKYKDKAQVIVVHDTEPGANYVYGMKDVLNGFKYRFDFEPVGYPHTTAVSNFIDVANWGN